MVVSTDAERIEMVGPDRVGSLLILRRAWFTYLYRRIVPSVLHAVAALDAHGGERHESPM